MSVCVCLYVCLSAGTYLSKCSAVAEMGDRLATIDMGRKVGAVSLWGRGEELGPHLTQCGQGRGLGYLCAKFHLDPSNRLNGLKGVC